MLEKLKEYNRAGLIDKQTHPTLPLTIWNYGPKVQYEGLWDEVTTAARGLVTDSLGNAVARPFRKFFNLSEGRHRPTADFEVFEKVDGSLGIIFNYGGEWHVATRGSFTSEQAKKGKRMLGLLIDRQGDSMLRREFTYLAEIVYPENRIVVDYGTDEKLVLLGANGPGGEAEHAELPGMWFEGGEIARKIEGFKTAAEIKEAIADWEEGFVVKFSNGDRAKVKGDEYLRLHRIMTCATTTSVWEALSQGDGLEEMLRDVPDEFYDRIKTFEKKLVEQHGAILRDAADRIVAFRVFRWHEIPSGSSREERKNFAEWAKTQPAGIRHILFCLVDGNDPRPHAWKMVRPEFRKL